MCPGPFPIFVLWLFESTCTPRTSDCGFLLDPALAPSQAQARLLSIGPSPGPPGLAQVAAASGLGDRQASSRLTAVCAAHSSALVGGRACVRWGPHTPALYLQSLLPAT